jgi:hypothetical protein
MTSDPATSQPTTDDVRPSDASDEQPEVEDQPATDPSVDTGPLERSEAAIDEARGAAAEALRDTPPDEDDMNFSNLEQNTDPEAGDNAVPRPN